MVEEYLSDREQEEALRTWWRENWRWVISGVALGLALLGAWQYWQLHSQAKAENASQAFRDLTTTLAGTDKSIPDKSKVDSLVKDLDSGGASPYADQAHLLLAQTHANAGRFEQAAAELKIVIDQAKDDILVQIARLRLARVQLQMGHPDEALALLDVNKAGAFAGQVHEVRGDALLAKGDRSGAKLEYQTALTAGKDAISGAGNETEMLRLKLQSLAGDESSEAAGASPKAK